MDKNVWVKETYDKYNNKVNDMLIKQLGHSNRHSQDVISMKPNSILQSFILLDILYEIKELNNVLTKKSENKEEAEKEDIKKDKSNKKGK